MNTYYLYINKEILSKFLERNLIYPIEKSYSGSKPLSLTYDNILICFKKKYNPKIIEKYCNDGLTLAIALEIELPATTQNIYQNEEMLILNDVISFSNVKKIYNISNKISPNYICNNIYLFQSLMSVTPFDGDCNDFDFEIINLNTTLIENVKDLTDKIRNYDKLQGFYCARFGFLNYEQIDKKKIVEKRNIDMSSWRYVSKEKTYNEFVNEYYDKVSKKSRKRDNGQKTLDDYNLLNILNDNFEIYLKNSLNHHIDDNSFEGNLFQILFDYQIGDLLELLKDQKWCSRVLNNINALSSNQIDDIAFLTKYFSNLSGNDEGKIIKILLILNNILNKDLDEARNYICNFISPQSESELTKELLSMYGLAKGMKAITYSIKKKPDILLFAYNKSKKYFDNYINVVSYDEYYKQRNYEPECLLDDGFDLKLFNYKEDYKYINRKIDVELLKSLAIEVKDISKKDLSKFHFAKNMRPNKLYKIFLIFKKNEMNCKPEYLLDGGFDLNVFNYKEEYEYINRKVDEKLLELLETEIKDISNKDLSKFHFAKNINPEKLHKIFLIYKNKRDGQ